MDGTYPPQVVATCRIYALIHSIFPTIPLTIPTFTDEETGMEKKGGKDD